MRFTLAHIKFNLDHLIINNILYDRMSDPDGIGVEMIFCVFVHQFSLIYIQFFMYFTSFFSSFLENHQIGKY